MAGRRGFLPPKGSVPIERHKVMVHRGGRDWNGSWEVEDGRLIVSSAYGSRSEPAGAPEERPARAEALLRDILDG